MTSTNTQPINPTELLELLAMKFSNSAEWRAGLEERHPNDRRNAEAAKKLTIHAETVKDIPDSLKAQYAAAYMDGDDNAGFELSERENEMRKAIGFGGSSETATEFVKELLA